MYNVTVGLLHKLPDTPHKILRLPPNHVPIVWYKKTEENIEGEYGVRTVRLNGVSSRAPLSP